MSRTERVNRLRSALQADGGRESVRVIAHSGVDACDVCVQAGSGLAFMRVVEPEQSVEEVWMTAQTQIDAFCDMNYRGRRPDLYLVLVSEGKLDPEDVALQAIASDPYVCRKLILEWADRPVERLLDSLPFWPLNLPELTIGEPVSPATGMGRRGYSASWIDLLLGRTGVKKVADQLHEGQLRIIDFPRGQVHEILGDESARPRSPRTRRKITAAEVQGFRVFGSTTHLDLDANLVVIYGRNSTGKTSLCEALEWGLLGEVERLKKPSPDAPATAEHPVHNLTARNSRVKLTLDRGGAARTVERWMSPNESKRCEVDGRVVTGDRESILKAVEADLPENASAAEVRESFRRYHFLDQTSLQDFLREVAPTARYQFLRPMLGTAAYGRVRERAIGVQKELAKLTTTTKAEHAEIEADVRQLAEELTRHDDEIQRWMSGIGLRDPDEAVAEAHRLALTIGLTTDTRLPRGLGAVTAFAELLGTSLPQQLGAARDAVRALSAVGAKDRIRRELEQLRASLTNDLVETRGQIEKATATKANHAGAANAKGDELTSLRDRIATLTEQRARHLRLTGLDDELRAAEAKLAELSPEDVGSVEVREQRAARLETDLLSAKEEYYNKRKALAEAERVLQHTIRTKEMLTQWLLSDAERSQCHDRLTLVATRREELARQTDLLVADRTRLEGELATARERAGSLGRALSDRNKLLLALQGHIEGDTCPLCRHTWPSHEVLVAAVEGAASTVPPELQRLEEMQRGDSEHLTAVQARLTEAKNAIAEADQQGRSARDRLSELEATAPQLATALGQVQQGLSLSRESLSVVEGAIASAGSGRDHAQREVQILEKRVRDIQIDLEQVNGEVAVLKGVFAANADDRRKLEQRIGQLTTETTVLRGSSGRPIAPDLNSLISEEEAAQDRTRSVNHELALARDGVQRADTDLAAAYAKEKGQLAALADCQSRLDSVVSELDRFGVNAEGTNIDALSDAAAGRLRTLDSVSVLATTIGTYARLSTMRETTEQTRAEWREKSAKMAAAKERLDHLGELAAQCDRFLADLNQVANDEETRRLHEYGPTINQIYQRLNRHPYFGDLVFEVNQANGEFKVQVDYNREQSTVGAIDYFSASQANVLALSVFLTSALLQNWSTLSTIILDDPVQHLDDLNTQSLLDLLHGLAALDRQVIVTTSNISLYKMMLLKYSHLNNSRSNSFKALRLRGIRHEGPEVFDDTAAAM